MAKTYPEQTARREASSTYDNMCQDELAHHICDLSVGHSGPHQCIMYPGACDKGEF